LLNSRSIKGKRWPEPIFSDRNTALYLHAKTYILQSKSVATIGEKSARLLSRTLFNLRGMGLFNLFNTYLDSLVGGLSLQIPFSPLRSSPLYSTSLPLHYSPPPSSLKILHVPHRIPRLITPRRRPKRPITKPLPRPRTIPPKPLASNPNRRRIQVTVLPIRTLGI
jgi:hypothetical protein